MKTLLLLLSILNLNTLDTHSNSYEPNPIMIDGLTYKIEEDYSISVEYKPYYIVENGKTFLVNEDLSLTLINN